MSEGFEEDQSQEGYQEPDDGVAHSIPAPLEEIAAQLQTAAQLLGKAAARKKDAAGFRTGMLVRHDEYGSGVILAITGKGPKRTATVKFTDQQERKFRLAFAPLVPVGNDEE